MEKHWMPLQGIPAQGTVVLLDDQDIWEIPIREFSLACRVLEPLTARVRVLPQEDGILFQGHIQGKVALPCDRCAAEGAVAVDHRFDSFEPFPAEPLPNASAREQDDAFGEVDEAVVRNAPNNRGIEFNPAALAWEEFLLALPMKPLCDEECKGLCPMCGGNRNAASCNCKNDGGDPRLAVLRELAAKKK